MMAVYHTPVMLNETLEALDIKSNGIYADLTLGGGGHSREIVKKLKTGKLIVFDQDTDALENIPSAKNIIPVHGNFRYLTNYFRYLGVKEVDGILADLGVSMHQFEEAGRGFTYRSETKLDMRMNMSGDKTAADVLNEYSEESLADMLWRYADLKQSRRIAKVIVQKRAEKRFSKTSQLEDCLRPFFRPDERNSFLARVFQALRIEVNAEMNALSEMLPQAAEFLKPGGRLVILTYHSIEDRMVKNFIKTGNVEGKSETDIMGRKTGSVLRAVFSKPLVANEEEIKRNPASRSAKLRVAEKI